MAILKRVENGEISPDEAARLIEGLDGMDEDYNADKELGGLPVELDSVFEGLGDALRAIANVFTGRTLSDGPKFEFTEVREGTFGVDRPELDFRCHNGRVSVESWHKDTYKMEIRSTVRAATREEARRSLESRLEIIDSPDRLAVKQTDGSSTRDVGVAINLFVPSNLRYNTRIGFHNGYTSFSRLTMDDCAIGQHNGRIKIEQVSALGFVANAHNGDAHLSKIDAEKCSVTLHNGRIIGDVTSDKCDVSTHNGQIRLRLSPKSELTTSVTAHNGSISVDLERADDIGYRVECNLHNGRPKVDSVREVLTEGAFGESSHGQQRRNWAGQSPDYESKPRKIAAKCGVHNGSISIGWIG